MKFYLSVEHCNDVRHGCPLTALSSELARVELAKRGQFFADLVNYRDKKVPFTPGRWLADKERAFFAIFSTMIGRGNDWGEATGSRPATSCRAGKGADGQLWEPKPSIIDY